MRKFSFFLSNERLIYIIIITGKKPQKNYHQKTNPDHFHQLSNRFLLCNAILFTHESREKNTHEKNEQEKTTTTTIKTTCILYEMYFFSEFFMKYTEKYPEKYY